jgi:hypothetical protein
MCITRNSYDCWRVRWLIVLSLLIAGLSSFSTPGLAQEPEQTTMTGTVVSSGRNTIVIRTEAGQFRLFTLDRNTAKPAAIANGSEVQVISSPTDDPAVRHADVVNVTRQPPAPAAGAAQPAPQPLPESIRNTERAIESEARRFQLGLRAGVGLQPELIMIGVHAQLGPVFRSIYLRPNGEFDWGERTKLFAINTEFIYRLPLTAATGRWSTYVGMGPGFNFATQRATGFDYSTSLNLLFGVRFRSGMFTELKTSVYGASSVPILRAVIGYNFY